MSQSNRLKLPEDVEILGKLLFRTKNQHRRTLYYKKSNHIYKLILKLQENSVILSILEKTKLLEKCKSILLKTLGIFSQQLHMGYFAPLCSILLGIHSKILSFVNETLSKFAKNVQEEAMFGQKVSRNSFKRIIKKKSPLNSKKRRQTSDKNWTKEGKIEDDIDEIFSHFD